MSGFRSIFAALLIFVAFQAIGQVVTPPEVKSSYWIAPGNYYALNTQTLTSKTIEDEPINLISRECIGANAVYRVTGEAGSTYTWTIKDENDLPVEWTVLGGTNFTETVTMTLPDGTATTVTTYGGETNIVWAATGNYYIEVTQVSEHSCKTTKLGKVEVYPQPEVSVDPIGYTCPNVPFTISGADALSYSTISWTTSGDGAFDNSNVLKARYTPGPNDIKTGQVILTIEAYGLGDTPGCHVASAVMTLYIQNLDAQVYTTTVTCNGRADGEIEIRNIRNGQPTYMLYVDGVSSGAGASSILYKGLSGNKSYSVAIHDANGCERDLGNYTILEPLPLIAEIGTFTPTCKGNDGQIIITNPRHAASELVGVPGNYKYVIEKNDGTLTKESDRAYGPTESYTFGGLATGTYTVEIYDALYAYCIQTLTPTVTLSDPEPLIVAATASDVTCFGANDGTVSVTLSTGGSGNYEYRLDGTLLSGGTPWNSGWVTAGKLIGVIPPGQFSLQMRDANNPDCVVTSSELYTIDEPKILAGTATSTDETCWNVKDGTIAIQSSTGGHGRYEYQITGTLVDGTLTTTAWASDKTMTGLAPGTYTLQMRDADFINCIQTIQPVFVIKAADKLLATLTPVPVKCFGEANGEIVITDARNGKGTYSFSVDGGTTWTTSTTITGLTAGTYTVTMRDNNNCSNDLDPVTITEPEKLVADYLNSTQTIAGKDVGTVTVTSQQGGMPYPGPDPYKYSKDNGVTWQTDPVFANLDRGTYTITISDANSCSYDMLVTIRSVGSITAKFTPNDVTCNGRNDGSITFYDFAGAASGKYEVSINNGLTWEKVTGATYTYSNLGYGYRDLVVREEGNAASESYLERKLIDQPASLQATVAMVQAEAGSTKNGIAEVTSFSGGSGSFAFRINGSAWQSDPHFTGLSKGDYVVDIRDPNSSLPDCYISKTVRIVGEGELTASVDITQPRCYGLPGTLKIVAAGVLRIEYSYDNGQSWHSGNVFNLSDGDYYVVVRDKDNPDNKLGVLNPATSGEWKIISPGKLELRSNYEWPTCQKPYATITIWGEGGTGQITGDVGVYKLPVGEFKTYSVYDQNYIVGQPGCMASQPFTSPSPSSITSDVTPTPALCYGGTGTITFTAPTNGKAPYTYTVKSNTFTRTSQTKLVFDNIPSGATYTCTVTDANGCKYETSVPLGPLVPLTALITVTSGSLCAGGVIVANISATGGTAPYKIGNDQLPVSRTVNLESGTQTFTITDANGCTTSGTISPVAPPDLQVTAPVLACSDVRASLQVEQPGYNPAKYEYSLNGGTATSTTLFTGLDMNTPYLVKVVDKLTACSTQTSVVTRGISIPSMPVVVLTQTPTCLNEDGTLVVTSPTGPEYAYKISGKVYITGGKTQSSTTFSNLKTDTYTITVINTLAGCESNPSAKEVPAIPPAPVIVVSGENPGCYGETFTLTISAPNVISDGKTYSFDGVYTFYYDGGQFDNVKVSGGTATITGKLASSYTFNNIRFTANGCTSTGTSTSVKVIVPDEILVTSAKVTEQALKGTQKGEISLKLNVKIDDLKFLWTSDTFTTTVITTTPNLTNLWNGTYTVTITDKNGCKTVKSYKVPANNPPVALPDEFITTCSSVTGNLLTDNGFGADYDPDSDELNDFITFNTTLVVKPAHAASFKVDASGNFEYVAQPNFTGDDMFVYEIYDKLKQTATATVTIHIVSDFDGDGIPDLADDDADGDGILNWDEALPGQDWKTADFDGDGHPNWLDIDSDNDGIVDNIEAQPTKGYIAPSGRDVNHNGIDDAYDPLVGGVRIIPVNTDSNLYIPDQLPDFLDTDSDNDGVPDYIEGHDLDADGKIDTGHLVTGKDSDSDGLDDAWDTVVNGCNNLNATGSNAFIQDFDGDGIRDWRDDNDDDDEYPTRLEDLNGDGDWSNDVIGHPGHPEYLWYGRDCRLFIPDAFSPNDDNVHDYFQIYCIEQYPNAKIFIFDQQGNKLFEKDHYGNIDYWGSNEKAWWDGTTTNRVAAVNGRKVVPGTYYYVLKLGNGETKKSFVFVSY